MSVYTVLNDEQFTTFCQNVGVSFKRAIPITQGVKNSNWFIISDESDKPSHVFTLFEERKPHEIIKMAQILAKLEYQLPVAVPLKAKNGEFIQLYDGKAITLVPVLQGVHPTTISEPMCHTMGQTLAVLHQTLQELTPAHHYGVELYPWHLVKDREIKTMDKADADLMNAIWDAYHKLPQDMPKGLCHLDMFCDNTLWDLSSSHLTGLLDFTEVSVEHFLMDIAITVNDFCTSWSGQVRFDKDKMAQFLKGYESVRPLTCNEKKALPVMLAMAAATFWLLRLNVMFYNKEQARAGDAIMVKDPSLMRDLARGHWQDFVGGSSLFCQ